jgi:hypothetical protein
MEREKWNGKTSDTDTGESEAFVVLIQRNNTEKGSKGN